MAIDILPLRFEKMITRITWKTAILLAAGFSCLSLTPRANAQNIPGLRALADKRGLVLGTAAGITALMPGSADKAFPGILKANFSMVEPENDFKPYQIWQGEGKYNWSDPVITTPQDWLLGKPGQTGWAQQNGIIVRGHVLVYDSVDYAIPGWLKALDTPAKQPDKATATRYLRDYIHAVVGRYRGKIRFWDVVNEAVNSGQSDDLVHNPYNLKKNLWYRWVGPEYIDLAFQYAHEADPAAQLYYNDFGDEFDNVGDPYDKFDNVFRLIKHLRGDKKIPANVGMQWHVTVDMSVTPGDTHYAAAQRLKDNQINFMVTELDVSMKVNPYPKNDPRFGNQPSNPADLEKQAAVYRDILKYALSFSNCKGLQVWGFRDKGSWIPGTFPGNGAATLMTADLAPKPAYFALQEELARR